MNADKQEMIAQLQRLARSITVVYISDDAAVLRDPSGLLSYDAAADVINALIDTHSSFTRDEWNEMRGQS